MYNYQAYWREDVQLCRRPYVKALWRIGAKAFGRRRGRIGVKAWAHRREGVGVKAFGREGVWA